MKPQQEGGASAGKDSAQWQKPDQRPKVLARIAMSVDGKLSANFYPSPASKAWLALVASPHTAVLAAEEGEGLLPGSDRVGRGQQTGPRLVVISNTGCCDPSQKIFHHPGFRPIVFSTTRMTKNVRDGLAPLCDLHLFESRSVPLREALVLLRRNFGVRTFVCERGGETIGNLAAEGLLDEIHLTVVPVVLGGSATPTLTGLPAGFLPEALPFRIAKIGSQAGAWFLHLKKTPQAESGGGEIFSNFNLDRCGHAI